MGTDLLAWPSSTQVRRGVPIGRASGSPRPHEEGGFSMPGSWGVAALPRGHGRVTPHLDGTAGRRSSNESDVCEHLTAVPPADGTRGSLSGRSLVRFS